MRTVKGKALFKKMIREYFSSHLYPYEDRLDIRDYYRQKLWLQVELVKLQNWSGNRSANCIAFEGRDAAGKGSTIAIHGAFESSLGSSGRAREAHQRRAGQYPTMFVTYPQKVKSCSSIAPGTTGQELRTSWVFVPQEYEDFRFKPRSSNICW